MSATDYDEQFMPESEIDALIAQYSRAEDISVCIQNMHVEINKLRARVAELEAENANMQRELTRYRTVNYIWP